MEDTKQVPVIKCPKCGGTGEVIREVDGVSKTLICSCRGHLIAKRALGQLYPYFDPTKEKNKMISLEPRFNEKNLFVHYTKSEDAYKKILSLIFFRNKIDKFEFVDAYRFMEMYLGQDEEYGSSRELISKNKALVIKLGKTEMDVKKFDNVVRMALLLADEKPGFITWVVSPYSINSDYLRKFYSEYTLPLFQGKDSIFKAVKL